VNCDNSLYAWKRFDKSGGHFDPLELGGSQHEGSNSRRCKCHSFGDPVADTVIFCKYDPAALADFEKPIFVFSVGEKVVVVNLDGLADIP
jgi:hypothetical protein